MASFLMAMARGPRSCSCCDNAASAVEVVMSHEDRQYSVAPGVGMPVELPIDSREASLHEDEVFALSPLKAANTKGGGLTPDHEAWSRPAVSAAAAKAAAIDKSDEGEEAASSDHIGRAELVRMSTAKFREVRASAQNAQMNEVQDAAEANNREATLAAGGTAESLLSDGSAQEGKPVKFRISIEKGDGKEKLGLDTVALVSAKEGVLRREKGALKVQAVKPDGLVSAWNSVHKRRQVRNEDFIVEVNGVRGTAEELYSAIAQGITLDIQLLRLP